MERNFAEFAFDKVCDDAGGARKGTSVAKPFPG